MAASESKIAALQERFHSRTLDELQAVQKQISEERERQRVAQDVLSRTEVRAPISGTLVKVNVFTNGGVIGRGEVIAEIVPSNDEMIVEARIHPQDIDVVHVGLSAHLHMTAFSQRNTMPLEGKVTHISADVLEDERTGEPYYMARISADGDSLRESGMGFSPGMQAEVMINTGERTVMDYLLEPILSSFRRGMTET